MVVYHSLFRLGSKPCFCRIIAFLTADSLIPSIFATCKGLPQTPTKYASRAGFQISWCRTGAPPRAHAGIQCFFRSHCIYCVLHPATLAILPSEPFTRCKPSKTSLLSSHCRLALLTILLGYYPAYNIRFPEVIYQKI